MNSLIKELCIFILLSFLGMTVIDSVHSLQVYLKTIPLSWSWLIGKVPTDKVFWLIVVLLVLHITLVLEDYPPYMTRKWFIAQFKRKLSYFRKIYLPEFISNLKQGFKNFFSSGKF